jgi:hypothetical protein
MMSSGSHPILRSTIPQPTISYPKRAFYIVAGTLIVLAGMGAFFVVGAAAGVVMAGMTG